MTWKNVYLKNIHHHLVEKNHKNHFLMHFNHILFAGYMMQNLSIEKHMVMYPQLIMWLCKKLNYKKFLLIFTIVLLSLQIRNIYEFLDHLQFSKHKTQYSKSNQSQRIQKFQRKERTYRSINIFFILRHHGHYFGQTGKLFNGRKNHFDALEYH